MVFWRFFNYITEDGRNPTQEWYAAQDESVKAQFDATLFLLRGLRDWGDEKVEEFKPLTAKHFGLGEMRFYVDALAPGARKTHRRRFRPVGIWPPLKDYEFLLLLGCEKTRMTYTPYRAFDVALGYKSKLEEGKGTISEHIW